MASGDFGCGEASPPTGSVETSHFNKRYLIIQPTATPGPLNPAKPTTPRRGSARRSKPRSYSAPSREQFEDRLQTTPSDEVAPELGARPDSCNDQL